MKRNEASTGRLLSLGLTLGMVLLCLCGCSIRKMAVNQLGDAFAQSSAGFASDDDPELIKDAAPFSLKLMETLLAESPNHTGLLQACASGFTQYAYAFVEQEADRIAPSDFAAAAEMRERARRLYQRARDYGIRGLETRRPGFMTELRANARQAVGKLHSSEIPLLYWTAAAWGKLVALSLDKPDTVADLPLVEALIDRALELDESFQNGALHVFLISYEPNRAGATKDLNERVQFHFERAVALSKGKSAGPYVTLAETMAIKEQDMAQFEALLGQALAVDPDAVPGERLSNIVMQKRARWLLERKDDLILPPDKP